MATVLDSSGNGVVTDVDRKLTRATRTNAGTPVGSLTPTFAGEIVFDTTNNVYYRGIDVAGTSSWATFNYEGP